MAVILAGAALHDLRLVVLQQVQLELLHGPPHVVQAPLGGLRLGQADGGPRERSSAPRSWGNRAKTRAHRRIADREHGPRAVREPSGRRPGSKRSTGRSGGPCRARSRPEPPCPRGTSWPAVANRPRSDTSRRRRGTARFPTRRRSRSSAGIWPGRSPGPRPRCCCSGAGGWRGRAGEVGPRPTAAGRCTHRPRRPHSSRRRPWASQRSLRRAGACGTPSPRNRCCPARSTVTVPAWGVPAGPACSSIRTMPENSMPAYQPRRPFAS